MSKPIFTQAQVDAIVARAVASTAAPAAVAAAVSDTASAPDAANAERGRIAAITRLAEAKGREGLAMMLATTTDMTVDQVKAALATAPAAAAGDRAGDTETGLLWDRVLSARTPTGQTGTPEAVADSAGNWDAVLRSKGLATGPGA